MRSKPGVFGQFVTPRSGLSGVAAPAFIPSDLFGADDFGDWWDFRTADGLFQDTSGATPVENLDPVGLAIGRLGNLSPSQSTTSSKPLWMDGSLSPDNSGSTNIKTLFDRFRVDNEPSSGNGVSVFLVYREGSVSPGSYRTYFGIHSATSHTVTVGAQYAQVRGDNNRPISFLKGEVAFHDFEDNVIIPQWSCVTWDGESATQKLYWSRSPDVVSADIGTVEGYRTVSFQADERSGGVGQIVGAIVIERDLSPEEIEMIASYYGEF